MKLKSLPLSLLCLFAMLHFGIYATPLTPEEALARVSSNGSNRSRGLSMTQMKLARAIHANDAAPADVYLFAGEGVGYLVVSADDSAPALLGYSDSGTIDADNIPPAMQYWLEEYARQIEAGRSKGVAQYADDTPERDPIEPMVTTKWNQSSPYNDLCPVANGKRCVTGCAATAMAQVLNYHQWPPQGVGEHTYTPINGLLDNPVTCNFADIAFDWENMLDTYDNSSPEISNKAVAELMFACGVSIDMNYSPQESGAYSPAIVPALVNYFDYDKGIAFLTRDYYRQPEWDQLVYDQLANYGPVLYSGVDPNGGGHAFVCDGYESDGFFHFNWGWAGVSDGYYRLTALNPREQGIGGSGAGYNFDQDIIANLCQPRPDSKVYINMVYSGDFDIEESSARVGERVTAMSDIGYFRSYTLGTVSGVCGLKITPAEDTDGEILYTTDGSQLSSFEYYDVFDSFYAVLPASIPDGVYNVTPAFKDLEGEWHDIRVNVNSDTYVVMAVDDGICYFESGDAKSIEIHDVKVESPIYLGFQFLSSGQLLANQFVLSATVVNPNDDYFVGLVFPVLIDMGLSDDEPGIVAAGDRKPVILAGGETMQMEYQGGFSYINSEELPLSGNYSLCFMVENHGDAVSDIYDVEVEVVPEVAISVSDLSIEGVSDPSHVVAGTHTISATVDCTEGGFGGSFVIKIAIPDSSEPDSYLLVHSLKTNPIFIAEGESGKVSATVDLAGTEEGRTYFSGIYFDNYRYNSDLFSFTVYDSSAGLEDVVADKTCLKVTGNVAMLNGVTNADIELFSLAGVKVAAAYGTDRIDLGSLAQGIYVATIHTPNGDSFTEKVVRK